MNQKYQVEIVETLKRVVEVEAWSQGNAEAKVNEMYRKSEIVLDDGDFDNVKIGRLNQTITCLSSFSKAQD